MVDLPSGPLAEVDLEFQKMALETGGFTFGLAGTSVREKLLQVTAHDICRGHLGLAFTMHITALDMHGVPYADMLALIRFVAPYAGYPAAADALSRVAQVAAERGLDTTPQPSRVAESSPGAAWPVDDPWLAEFLASRTGRAWSEERLSGRERAFVALTAHVARNAFGESFRKHVALALQFAGPDEIRDALRFTAELSVTDTAEALEALEKALAAA
ncbi:hypothetical protein [Nonomuraea sp. B5E05]|uniref:hypothetical protein n=1 Tax=Nonomuraea sp. B5E05 TaxID=3153569 RepID=UPI0032614A1C